MLIELHLSDPYDGLTRVLQVLRMSECGIRRLEIGQAGETHVARLDLAVPPERLHLVEVRIAGVIGVGVRSIRHGGREELSVAA